MPSDNHSMAKPISIFDEAALYALFDHYDVKKENAYRLWKFVIHHPNIYSLKTFDECPDIPKALPMLLQQYHFRPLITTVDTRKDSSDGTVKLLIRLQNENLVETVVMHYDRKNDSTKKARSSVCISSQVGCKMACSFCATGTMGFKTHLSAAEIIEQLVHARQTKEIHSVVFMGMGEPMDNYLNVVASIKTMIDRKRFAIAPSKICISTVGVIGKIRAMMDDVPGVKLALSLHAPTQELRAKIVPTAKAFPLDKLMIAIREYLTRSEKIMIEYILIDDVNIKVEHAHQLGALLQDINKKVLLNLIPYNPTEVDATYKAPSQENVHQFEMILRNTYGILTIVRRTLGQDIDGACGQLVVKLQREQQQCGRSGKKDVADMEDLFGEDSNEIKSPKKRKIVKRRDSSDKDKEVGEASRLQQVIDFALPVGCAILVSWLMYRVTVKVVSR